MSKHRFPLTSGHGMLSTTARRSNHPGVVTPGTMSMVWYQKGCSSTRFWSSWRSGALTSMRPETIAEKRVSAEGSLPNSPRCPA